MVIIKDYIDDRVFSDCWPLWMPLKCQVLRVPGLMSLTGVKQDTLVLAYSMRMTDISGMVVFQFNLFSIQWPFRFRFHHTAGDSMLVEDPANLDRCAAIWAATAYVVADLSIAMPKTILHN